MTPNDLPPELIRIVSSFLDYYSRAHLHCTLDENFPSKRFTKQQLEDHECEVARSDLLILLHKFSDERLVQTRCSLIIKFLKKINNDLYLKMLCSHQKTFQTVVLKLNYFEAKIITDYPDVPSYFKQKISKLSKIVLKKILNRGYKPFNFKALI